MEQRLTLTDASWTYGSYPRIEYKKDMLYTFFRYRDFEAVYNRGSFSVTDRLAERLATAGLILVQQKAAYDERITAFVMRIQQCDQWPVEKIYGEVLRLRRECLGAPALQKDWLSQARDRAWGAQQKALQAVWAACERQASLWQERKRDAGLAACESVIFALCEPEWFSQMMRDIQSARALGRRIYLTVRTGEWGILPDSEELSELLGEETSEVSFLSVTDEAGGLNPAGFAWEENISRDLDRGKLLLMVYGENGLVDCKSLRADAVVYAAPAGFYAQAACNQLDGIYPCLICVPAHFDITRQVGLTEKSRITYWQLARLWEAYGDEICGQTVEELYLNYPQYFINIYENGKTCPEAQEDYPIQVHWPKKSDKAVEVGGAEDVLAQFYRLRDEAVRDFLNGRPGVRYVSAYFDENQMRREICWAPDKPQDGILVQGICVERAKESRVISCHPGETLRQMVRRQGTEGIRLWSNFLFFLTPKLAACYNAQRADRPREQLRQTAGHLDYRLTWEEGERRESFPLYRKACIAMKEDGSFLFFHYRLGGGSMEVCGCRFRWETADVDASDGSSCPVIVHTPYASAADREAASDSYALPVGAGRVNLVVIGEQIICVRRGEVLQPCIGAVVSLDEKTAKVFLEAAGQTAGLMEAENGYFVCSKTKGQEKQSDNRADLRCDLPVKLCLDGPDTVPAEEWHRVKWAYGGGLSLIADGNLLCTGRGREQNAMDTGFAASLKREGWLSPLSRQTQETAIEQPARHPRTAIGVTASGSLFVLVFSGRTKVSAGADYGQMCRIAGELYPDVQDMMNVDGGGSAVLGLSVGENFMELSVPATSASSCAGMARPVSTVLCIGQ